MHGMARVEQLTDPVGGGSLELHSIASEVVGVVRAEAEKQDYEQGDSDASIEGLALPVYRFTASCPTQSAQWLRATGD